METSFPAAVTTQPKPDLGLKLSNSQPNAVEQCVICLGTACGCLCYCCIQQQAQQFERYVIFRAGRIRGEPRGPGMFPVLPFCDRSQRVDIRTQTFNMKKQDMLTKDSLSVTVNAVVFYKIVEPLRAVLNIKDVHDATRKLAATTLRNAIGALTLKDLLESRHQLANDVRESLDSATDVWGIRVERVELSDITLPAALRKAMAAEAEATREANAKKVAAQGELDAAKMLAEAARVIAAEPAALQLREMQTLQNIGQLNPVTILYPVGKKDSKK